MLIFWTQVPVGVFSMHTWSAKCAQWLRVYFKDLKFSNAQNSIQMRCHQILQIIFIDMRYRYHVYFLYKKTPKSWRERIQKAKWSQSPKSDIGKWKKKNRVAPIRLVEAYIVGCRVLIAIIETPQRNSGTITHLFGLAFLKTLFLTILTVTNGFRWGPQPLWALACDHMIYFTGAPVRHYCNSETPSRAFSEWH